jgi:hypothetical protein
MHLHICLSSYTRIHLCVYASTLSSHLSIHFPSILPTINLLTYLHSCFFLLQHFYLFNSTNPKCRDFRYLEILLHLTPCDIYCHFFWITRPRNIRGGGGRCFSIFEILRVFFIHNSPPPLPRNKNSFVSLKFWLGRVRIKTDPPIIN